MCCLRVPSKILFEALNYVNVSINQLFEKGTLDLNWYHPLINWCNWYSLKFANSFQKEQIGTEMVVETSVCWVFSSMLKIIVLPLSCNSSLLILPSLYVSRRNAPNVKGRGITWGFGGSSWVETFQNKPHAKGEVLVSSNNNGEELSVDHYHISQDFQHTHGRVHQVRPIALW